MEGFTLAMALVDAIPVLCFGIGMVLIGVRFPQPLFLIGAAISMLAACRKVAWKLVLGIWHRNIPWLNKYFLPIQFSGFGLMLLSFALGFGKINWPGVLDSLTGFPACLFFAVWVLGMGMMIWYKKARFDNSAKANWTAQIINCVGQAALLLGILFI